MLLTTHQIAKSMEDRTILHPLNLTIRRKERLAIIGETGSGKTTLLKSLAGLMDLDSGEIFFLAEKVMGPSAQLLPGHPGISYLHQAVHLRNHYKVADLMERHSIQDFAADRELARICRVEHLLDRMTDQLSGGERQRIALAIELSKHPKLLLLDEPFSNLDIGHRNTLRAVLDDLHAQIGLTFVIVSHNPSEVLGWADQIMVMQAGRCVQMGTPHEIYESPVNEYVAQLLGPYTLMQSKNGDPTRFVRPERIHLTAADTSPIKGVVIGEEYEGHSSIYTVKAGEKIWLIRNRSGQYILGEEVGIFVESNTDE